MDTTREHGCCSRGVCVHKQIKDLDADNARLRAELEQAHRELAQKSEDVHCLRGGVEYEQEKRAAAEAKLARVVEALTPSAETKAEYIGEFRFGMDGVDEDGDERTIQVTVPWTTTKEIMAAIRKRAALAEIGGGEGRATSKDALQVGEPSA